MVKDQYGMSIIGIGNIKRETKNYTKEAEELLRKRLENIEFTKDNITIIFTKMNKVDGHTEISIRKSK